MGFVPFPTLFLSFQRQKSSFKLHLELSFANAVSLVKIDWCLKPFSTVFQLYDGSQRTYPCFPGVLLTNTLHNIHSKPLAASHVTIVETMGSSERGMNPIAVTLINPGKEYWLIIG